MWYDMGERKMMVLKIVVLAGGLSTERAVSLVTGVGVCRALRENGHRAVLADLYLGLGDVPELHATNFHFNDEAVLPKGLEFLKKLLTLPA